MDKYYKLPCKSETGKKLANFWHRAKKAAMRADAYAKRMGASAYIQPVQFFEGGVDFLEFSEQPDLRVWRERTDLGETPLYEPNCEVRQGVTILKPGDDAPSSVWNKVYDSNILGWEDIRRSRPASFWLSQCGMKPTGDTEKDWSMLASLMSNKLFVTFLEFVEPEGVQPPVKYKRKAATYFHRAVKAEQLRLALPVVKTEEFYAFMGLKLPDVVTDLKAFCRNLSTPTFFEYDEHFFVFVQGECTSPDLTEINKQLYIYYENTALRVASQRERDYPEI